MPKQSIPALIRGPYAMPPCEIGSRLHCQLKGWVKVDWISEAPIPWPTTLDTATGTRQGKPSIILCGDLIAAVRAESVSAICYHWDVDRKRVRIWRRALGVDRFNPGTMELWKGLAVGKLHKPKKPPAKTR